MAATIERFIKQRAVDLAVDGTYTLHHWYDPDGRLRTFECRTIRLSPFRLMAEAPVVGKIDGRLTVYFPEFGELEASITDTAQGRFLLKLDMPRDRRAWMAAKLDWLERKQCDQTVQDCREDVRLVPKVSLTTLTLADGSVHPCFIIDVSSGGVAVLAQHRPELETPVAIGACVGRVIRHCAEGFAVKFAEKHRIDDVMRLVVREDGLRANSTSAGKREAFTETRSPSRGVD